ncbi:MAG: hypothetical protein AVDCRST_MAG41-3159, partial [uncultured Corynebacteriales bacterium]
GLQARGRRGAGVGRRRGEEVLRGGARVPAGRGHRAAARLPGGAHDPARVELLGRRRPGHVRPGDAAGAPGQLPAGRPRPGRGPGGAGRAGGRGRGAAADGPAGRRHVRVLRRPGRQRVGVAGGPRVRRRDAL